MLDSARRRGLPSFERSNGQRLFRELRVQKCQHLEWLDRRVTTGSKLDNLFDDLHPVTRFGLLGLRVQPRQKLKPVWGEGGKMPFGHSVTGDRLVLPTAVILMKQNEAKFFVELNRVVSYLLEFPFLSK
jgi:hypothetical protein